ncbi:MAG: hypothetical protein K0R17_373 [Rariglobus sp.]|jgi:hypothetical protein|nr:hypothetical protein [Rariglobus sp.]
MKPLSLLLALSLVANAAFITTRVMHSSSARTDENLHARSSSADASAASASGKSDAVARADFIAALKADNVEALRDVLREAGLPDATVRMIVSSAIWSRYRDRMKSLQPKPDPNQPWWKNQNNNWYGNSTREQRAEMRRLQREAKDESVRLLGPDKDSNAWGWQDPRISFLPEAKREDLQEIEQDYQDLLNEVQQEMQGFNLPSDAEKIRFLQEEKKRDLAAILTPQEMADYELRMSPTAQQLSWKMNRFDGSEDEYRKIFALQQAFDSTQQLDAWGNPIGQSPDDWKKRQDAEKQLGAQIKEALGAERYAEYLRSQNHEYQQLATAAKRLSLPPETATQVYNLRNEVAAESQRIADNTSLGNDQKKQALADLAKKIRGQVRASLGEEAAQVYLKNGMHWLSSVEHGNVVTFSENGQHSESRGLPPEQKKPAAKP